jgi:hypothetical protein
MAADIHDVLDGGYALISGLPCVWLRGVYSG